MEDITTYRGILPALAAAILPSAILFSTIFFFTPAYAATVENGASIRVEMSATVTRSRGLDLTPGGLMLTDEEGARQIVAQGNAETFMEIYECPPAAPGLSPFKNFGWQEENCRRLSQP